MEDKKVNFFKSGSYIYIEGDEDVDAVYIVENGEIELKCSNEKVTRHKYCAKNGEIFGFISALSRRPRIESAVAVVDSKVVTLSMDRFLALLQQNSKIAVKILNSFADELRTYDEMIFSSDESQNDLNDEMEIFNLGKYYFDDNIYENAYYIMLKYLQLYTEGEYREEARNCINSIESTGLRKIAEPIVDGMYRNYAENQIIFSENEPGDELFIIHEGKVKIVKYHNNSEIMLSVLTKGDVFGELAIVSDKTRNATAISYGNSVLIPIYKDSLLKLFKKSPEILKKIFMSISDRIWFTFIRIEAKLYEKPLTRLYAFLENKLLEENISLKSRDEHIFHFGIDELFEMTNISQENMGDSLNLFLTDPNFNFNFGRIKADDSSQVSAKAKYFKARDHLSSFDNIAEQDEKSAKKIGKSHECESENQAGKKTDAGLNDNKGDLFDEMFDDLSKIEE